MAEHRWSILCSHAVVDRFTNNVSLLDLVEQITVGSSETPSGPIPIALDLMTMWERTVSDAPEASRSRVVIVSPDGTEDELAQSTIDLTGHQRLRIRLRVMGIPFHGFGRYRFRVDRQVGDGWVPAGHTELHVVAGPVRPDSPAARQ